MFKGLCSVAALFFIMMSSHGFAQSIVKFNLPHFPPYTFEKDGVIQGIGVELVDKIFKEARIQYTVKVVPNYGRAIQEIKAGRADGFFLASQNAERDAIAVFSNPVTTNNWCWFFPVGSKLNPKDEIFKADAKVGTQLNTNTHKWLKKNGYNVAGSPPHVDAILKMLKLNRINVVFLAEAVFFDLIHKSGEKKKSYKKVLQQKKPFGIYISKEYLLKNPGIMENINAAIGKVVGGV